MIPAQAVETERDGHGRPNKVKLVSGNAVHALTQTSYDALGRPDCVARRMTPAAFGSLPADACALGAQGGDGPDRIARTIYDSAGRAVQVKTVFAIPSQVADEVTTTYTANGLVKTVTDAENNRTTYEYDDHDRLVATRYPVAAKGADASAPTSGAGADFEALTYESLPGGGTSNLVASFRNRRGDLIGFSFDPLGRLTSKNLPNAEPDVTYSYDLLGRMTSASQPGHALSFTFDALGRVLTQTGPLGTMTSEWDLAGRRTKLSWPDTFFVTYDHLVTGETTRIRENGAASGIGVLATFGYDPQTVAGQLGQRTSLTRGNGTVTSYQYDPVSRLQQLKQDVEGAATANDLTLNFGYNPASQISLTTRSNPGSSPGQADLYAWTGHGSGTTGTTSNGRNQIANWVNALSYDPKGNVTQNGTYTYSYSSENLLTSLTNSAPGAIQSGSTYAYDPLMRLAKIDSSNAALDADLGYDGQEIVLEGLSAGRTRRYVFGPGVDEPLVAYLVTSTGTSRSWYHSDERGSTIRQTNDAGTPAGGIGRYDEYGAGPGTSRFQYTGQYWLGDGNLLYYRARIYDARLGRFLQPDPIGYGGGMNLYAYVAGDPVNFTDPLGLKGEEDEKECGGDNQPECDITIWGHLIGSGTGSGPGGHSFGGDGGVLRVNPDVDGDGRPDPDIVVTGKRPPQSPAAEPSLVKQAVKCALDQFGVSDLIAAGAVAAGQPIPGTKPYVNPGSSRGTSVAGMAADRIFGNTRLPRRLPTIVGGPGTGRALAIAGTKSAARFAGRAVPIVGWAWLAYDAVSIAVCTARSR